MVQVSDNPFEHDDIYISSLIVRFEVDDLELQDEPLQIRIMDYDTYSANDAIGKVYIDLNPLLLTQPGHRQASNPEAAGGGGGGGSMMSGWLPKKCLQQCLNSATFGSQHFGVFCFLSCSSFASTKVCIAC